MHKVVVYLDDPASARSRLPGPGAPTHWLLVTGPRCC